jgi:hypothetical protein
VGQDARGALRISVCTDPYASLAMILRSSDAQRYLRALRYYDRRGENPELVAALKGAAAFDMDEGPQDYFHGRGVRLAEWLSLLDDPDRLGRVSGLTVERGDLTPAEADLHARVLADAQSMA